MLKFKDGVIDAFFDNENVEAMANMVYALPYKTKNKLET